MCMMKKLSMISLLSLLFLFIIIYNVEAQSVEATFYKNGSNQSEILQIIGARSLALLIHKWVISIPPPSSEKVTKNAWRTCFKIFIKYLLPLGIAVLGFYQIFIFSSPREYILKELTKRIFLAIFLAYFGFTIIDAICKITNKIGEIIISEFTGNYGYFSLTNLIMTLVPASTLAIIGSKGAVVPSVFLALSGLISTVTSFLVLIIVLLFTRITIVHIVSALLPILCFFIIIGVGPLRRLSDIAELFFSLGITSPIFSIVGAFLLAFAEKCALTSIPLAIGSFTILITFPYLSFQMAGFFKESLFLVERLHSKFEILFKSTARKIYSNKNTQKPVTFAQGLIPLSTSVFTDITGIANFSTDNDLTKLLAYKLSKAGLGLDLIKNIGLIKSEIRSKPSHVYRALSIPLKSNMGLFVLKKYGYSGNPRKIIADALTKTFNFDENKTAVKNLYTLILNSGNQSDLNRFLSSDEGKAAIKQILINSVTRGYINAVFGEKTLMDLKKLSKVYDRRTAESVGKSIRKRLANKTLLKLLKTLELHGADRNEETNEKAAIKDFIKSLKANAEILDKLPENKILDKLQINQILKLADSGNVSDKHSRKLICEFRNHYKFKPVASSILSSIVISNFRSSRDLNEFLRRFIEGGGYLLPKNFNKSLNFIEKLSKYLKTEYMKNTANFLKFYNSYLNQIDVLESYTPRMMMDLFKITKK